MSTKQEEAVKIFNSGYNCAQSVLSVFVEDLDMSIQELQNISAGFGGGMGKMQETCGAVTGAFMFFGLWAGKQMDERDEVKALSNKLVREFTERYKEAKGSIQCLHLLGADMNTEEGQNEIKEKGLIDEICPGCVSLSVGIIEEMIVE